MGEAGEEVLLYVYDLTGGMAQILGQSLLRKSQRACFVLYRIVLRMLSCPLFFTEKSIEGIWHTAVVVFGKEHFFGSNGISVCDPVSAYTYYK